MREKLGAQADPVFGDVYTELGWKCEIDDLVLRRETEIATRTDVGEIQRATWRAIAARAKSVPIAERAALKDSERISVGRPLASRSAAARPPARPSCPHEI